MKFLKILFSNWFLCSILVLVCLCALLFEFSPLQFLEYKAYDYVASLREKKVESPVVVVAIDSKSIQTIGDWPWPRSYIADMVQCLSEGGAKAQGIHLLFSSRELNPGLDEIKALREILPQNEKLKDAKVQHIIDSILEQSEKKLNHDDILISKIRSAVNVILPLRFSLESDPNSTTHHDTETLPEVSAWLMMNSLILKEPPTASGKFGEVTTLVNEHKELHAGSIQSPFHELSTKARGLGHINIRADSDGLIRRVPLFIQYGKRYFPSFSLQLVMKYLKTDISNIKLRNSVFGTSGLYSDSLDISTDKDYRMFIDFNNNCPSFETYSFSDILDNNCSPGVFRDKIVLVGLTAHDIVPHYQTAYHTALPSVMIAATVVENILNKRFISRPAWAPCLEILIVLYFGFLLLFVIPKVTPKIGAIILGSFLIMWFGGTSTIFILSGYWLKVFIPLFLSIFGYAIVEFKTFSEKRQEENIELKKMVGLSFQSKGMLDMAYEKFLQCPIEDQSVKELFYNLGLDFERKRMFNKALTIYTHIFKAGKFKDIKDRIQRLKSLEEQVVLSMSHPPGQDKTLLLEHSTTTPTLGRYEIIKELGQGAMGTVYLGRDPMINREVAIKTVKYAHVDKEQLSKSKERFFREAEAAGKLNHPNIVTIFDVGEDYDMAYIAMEYIDGSELTEFCQRRKLLSVKRVLSLLSSVADALAYAHSHGVVHRDIKPSNIMLLKNSLIKVTDFGIAQLMSSTETQTGTIYGTPHYMSPEQLKGKKLDGHSDLFSLGIVFYELLTGERPFKGDNITNIMYAITNVDYIPLAKIKPNLPSCCTRILEGLLTKTPQQRIQSADKLVDQIQLSLKNLNKKRMKTTIIQQ
ncbi:MAG: CHASE2 domain-containing serine/threonine-protein kinase [bacterium]